MINPLYAKLYTIPYFPKLPKQIIEVLKLWVSISTTMPPLAIWRRPGLNDNIIYTDAAFDQTRGGLAAVVCDHESYRFGDEIMAEYIIRSYDPVQINRIIDIFHGPSPIFGPELEAVAISISQLRYFLMSRTITIFVDNNAALGALVRGTSTVLAARRFVSTFWWVVSMFSISVRLESVAPEWNCAGAPSRNIELPFLSKRDCPFSALEEFLSTRGISFPTLSSCFYTAEVMASRW